MFNKLIQVGIVTREIDRILKSFLSIYKVGPWYVIRFSPENVESMTHYGRKQDYSMDITVCPIGDVRFEYIGPITSSIYSDFYDTHGEDVIHHLKLGVDDYGKALESLKTRNIKDIQSGHQLGDKGKNIYTYVDSYKKLGFITEIVHITEDFIKPAPEYWYPSRHSQFVPVFIRPSAVGVVVRDVEAKIRDYYDLNIGPWEIHDFKEESSLSFKAKMAFCRLGNVLFKLIEPKSASIFSDFLEKSRENIHHLKMEVNDYEKALKYLQSKGVNVILSGSYKDEINFSFLDTDKHINFITEISDKKIQDNIAASEQRPKPVAHP
jgi:hypothetical protein